MHRRYDPYESQYAIDVRLGYSVVPYGSFTFRRLRFESLSARLSASSDSRVVNVRQYASLDDPLVQFRNTDSRDVQYEDLLSRHATDTAFRVRSYPPFRGKSV